MSRHFDEVMADVASFLPKELYDELWEVIDQEIADVESCYTEGSDEVLNER